MKPQQYFMKFDNNIKFGSPEHYFHFMWGYLLPGVHQIFNIEEKIRNSSVTKNRYIFKSCGPVMNNVLDEFLQFHNINYEISKIKGVDKNKISKIFVPRWDVWLIDLKNWKNFKSWTRAGNINLNLRGLENIMAGIRESIFPRKFLAAIHQIRQEVFSKINYCSNEIHKKYNEKYLLIKRSPQPDYYKRGGKAEKPTYGSARRQLIGIEHAAEKLKKNDIPVEIFQPGKHSLVDQIQAFKACEGVIGIIGAELSNLIWMEPEKRLIILTPLPATIHSPVFPTLARLMGHYCCEIVPSYRSRNIEIDDELLIRTISEKVLLPPDTDHEICYI